MGAILQYGLSVALVGIGTVFVGLIILIALIKLMEIVMASATGKKKAAAPAPAAPAPVAEEPVEETDDDELIAVIAAAVAAAMEQSGPDVRSRSTAGCNRRTASEQTFNFARRISIMRNFVITVNGTSYEVAVEEVEAGAAPAAAARNIFFNIFNLRQKKLDFSLL